MAAYAPIKIQHTPINTWPGTTQTGFVGAQTVAGQRGALPTFNTNSYYVAKTGNDANAGTSGSPKLTLGSLFSTTQSFNDTSGNGNNLTQTGTVPYISYPCRPIPPQGNFAAGPFSASNYLNGPAGLYNSFDGISAFTVEMYFFAEDLSNGPTLFEVSGAHVIQGAINGSSQMIFNIAGTTMTAATPTIQTGQWYYVAFVYTSGASGGKQIWLGSSPETAVSIGTPSTQAQVIGNETGATIGNRASDTTRGFVGYIDRVVYSTTVARTSFPTLPTDSNIAGFYGMETSPLMLSAPKDYIVVQDSGTYNEGLYANFQYDITSGFGIYAADGFAPTFKLQKGVFPGTYGAGNSTYVPLTNSPSTTCYVSKSGNNGTGTRGDASFPFLTIQAALNATTTAGDTVEITDSGTYTEDLTQPARDIVIQASSGSVPIVKKSSTVAASGQITGSGTNSLSLAGIIFVGNNLTSILFKDAGSANFVLYSCIVQNYYSIVNQNAIPIIYDSYFIGSQNFSTSLLGKNWTVTNCFFTSSIAFIAAGGPTMNFNNCTINGNISAVDPSVGVFYATFNKCLVYEATIETNGGALAGLEGMVSFYLCNFFNSSNVPCFVCNTFSPVFIYGCNFRNIGTGIGIKAEFGVTIWIENCSFIDFDTGIYLRDSIVLDLNAKILNVSTMNCVTAGIDAIASNTYAQGLADSGSGVPYQSGVTPTQSISDAAYLSTVSGQENLCLSADSPGSFLFDNGVYIQDAGAQPVLFDVVMPSVRIDGLIFEGEVNQEGGIRSLTAITLQYCTFLGLGFYGVLPGASSFVYNCLYSVNGHAMKDGQYSCQFLYDAGYACAGAFMQHYGRSTDIENLSSYACQYGQYDSLAASFTNAGQLIYSNSGAYDYSGEDELTYSCVGTLDPSRANSIDANSIQSDPLFVDAANGDLTLQALAREFFWNSPCVGTGGSGTDMGAYIWTYGVLNTSYTTIDFSTSGYRNPDTVVRRQLPIKLAEGDMENGAIYSVSATFKKEYDFTWNPDSSDMPLAQLNALITMFLSYTNQIRIDFGDGRGYIPAFFGRTVGFEYADMTGLYSDDTVPEPLRAMTVREA